MGIFLKLIGGNKNLTRGSKMRLNELSKSPRLLNYIINGVMFSALNKFSNAILIIPLLENQMIPKFTLNDVIMTP